MKKIVLALGVFIIFSTSMANAEIKNKVDEFSGIIVIESKSYDVPKGAISFRNTGDAFELSFWMPSDGNKFTKDPVLIKINENQTQDLVVTETIFKQVTKSIMDITVSVNLPAETVNQIKRANRVALKFYKDKGEPVVIVLPDNVLAEWKQVINTGK